MISEEKIASIRIVLSQYKNGNITEDEIITLLKDLCSSNTIINNPPYYPWTTQPLTTYNNPEFPKYEVTCKTE